MDMAEVGCQLRQQVLHVCSLTIPGDQAMDCEGMPQIMKSRLVTTSIMALHAGAGTQSAEDIFRCVARHRSSGVSQEKRRARRSGVILGSLRHIISQGA